MTEPVSYIASCSFGKDSLAAILVWLESGNLIDDVVYCEIWFDEKTPAELPEHYQWIHEVAIPKLKADYGLETTVIRADVSYIEQFYRKAAKGHIYGFPLRQYPWCVSELKRRPLNNFQKETETHKKIIGFAADEGRRVKGRMAEDDIIFPLIEQNITEAQAFEICEKAGLLSPAYNKGRTRLGCFFCPNQPLCELERLRNEYPELWAHLLRLDKDSPRTFRGDYLTVTDLEHNFSMNDRQIDFLGKDQT